MNAEQRKVFHDLLDNPPGRIGGIGVAYWTGYENPSMTADEAGPITGAPDSAAHAAFRAGQSAARRKRQPQIEGNRP